MAATVTTTRTGNLIQLREQKPTLTAELQPLETRGWKEGRNFRQTAAANAPTYRHPARVQAVLVAALFASLCLACGAGFALWKLFS